MPMHNFTSVLVYVSALVALAHGKKLQDGLVDKLADKLVDRVIKKFVFDKADMHSRLDNTTLIGFLRPYPEDPRGGWFHWVPRTKWDSLWETEDDHREELCEVLGTTAVVLGAGAFAGWYIWEANKLEDKLGWPVPAAQFGFAGILGGWNFFERRKMAENKKQGKIDAEITRVADYRAAKRALAEEHVREKGLPCIPRSALETDFKTGVTGTRIIESGVRGAKDSRDNWNST